MSNKKTTGLPKRIAQQIVVISCEEHGAHVALVSALEADVADAMASCIANVAELQGKTAYHTERISGHPSTDIDLRSHRWQALSAVLAEGGKDIHDNSLDRDELPF